MSRSKCRPWDFNLPYMDRSEQWFLRNKVPRTHLLRSIDLYSLLSGSPKFIFKEAFWNPWSLSRKDFSTLPVHFYTVPLIVYLDELMFFFDDLQDGQKIIRNVGSLIELTGMMKPVIWVEPKWHEFRLPKSVDHAWCQNVTVARGHFHQRKIVSSLIKWKP